MTTQDAVVEVVKVVASVAIPYIALLRTRADLDRVAAKLRASESGSPFESQIRCRWYHRLKPMKVKR